MNFSISMYSTPSAYLSIQENKVLNQKSRSNNSQKYIIRNRGFPTNNSINLKLNSDSINYPSTKKTQKKNIFKLRIKK